MAFRGMVSAPHPLAAQAGLAVLREGGNAIEAAVAAAATCAVVAPHRNGLGGDGFWLIHEPGKIPMCIDACGAAGAWAKPQLYRSRTELPAAGPMAANVVAGAVSGWQAALEIGARWGGRLGLPRLLEDAIHYARTGFAATWEQKRALLGRADEVLGQPGFDALYAPGGVDFQGGTPIRQPGLAALLERLAQAGLDDFYRGTIGHHLGAELQRVGSPLTSEDLARHRSVRRRPLSLSLGGGQVYSLPPPTQGLAALMILGFFERLAIGEAESVAHVHGLIEAAKLGFAVRDSHVTDPAYMNVHSTTYLNEGPLQRMSANIAPGRALPWEGAARSGSAAWLGVIDGDGRAASCLQTLGGAFGTGVAVGEFGLLWHNRGSTFELAEEGRNALAPGRKPYHSACPALARCRDGRLLLFGAMGGDEQAESLAAVFTRVQFGQDLDAALAAPRWRLRSRRGARGYRVDLEDGFSAELVEGLAASGHEVARADAGAVGEAAALLRQADGRLDGAADPRADGCIAAF
jgi:oxamate amidohydrolase